MLIVRHNTYPQQWNNHIVVDTEAGHCVGHNLLRTVPSLFVHQGANYPHHKCLIRPAISLELLSLTLLLIRVTMCYCIFQCWMIRTEWTILITLWVIVCPKVFTTCFPQFNINWGWSFKGNCFSHCWTIRAELVIIKMGKLVKTRYYFSSLYLALVCYT